MLRTDVDNPFNAPTVLSLCSGGLLGLERGIEAALGRIHVAAYVEIEAFLCQNLVTLMEQGVLDAAPVWTDVKTFPAQEFRGRIHGITAGYPCQPFSIAGVRQGEEDDRHLFPHILRIVEAVRPFWCFFENVTGHLTLGYDQVYKGLRNLGYAVEAGVFSAAEAGATHDRERLFIFALMGNPDIAPAKYAIPAGRDTASITSKTMEHSEPGRCQQYYPTIGKNQQHNEGCDAMVNSIGTGPEQHGREITGRPELSTAQCTSPYDFPAPPGTDQYPWEASRLESRMGFTINGYNYREDLLRMAGNGVVWQTAAIAARTLLKIHMDKNQS